MNIVLAKWRCHGENALEHDRDLEEDDGVKKVKPSMCLAQGGRLQPRASETGMVYGTRTYEKHGQQVTVWNVTFPDVPGGPQDP
jgi:hypothetical protein